MVPHFVVDVIQLTVSFVDVHFVKRDTESELKRRLILIWRAISFTRLLLGSRARDASVLGGPGRSLPVAGAER